MKRLIVFITMICTLITKVSAADKVLMQYDGKSITIELYDNKAAKDFLKRLPLSLYMENYKNAAIYASIDSLATDSTPDKTAQRGVLYYYATTKQLWYNYDVCIIPLPIQEIGKVIEKKNIFQNIYAGGDITFTKKEE